jgi:hypothetical protein
MGSGSSESHDESPEDIRREMEAAASGFCPMCGSKLVSFNEKDGSGRRCAKCGWSCFFSDDLDASGEAVDVNLAKLCRKFDKALTFLHKECPNVGDAYAVSKFLVLFFEERVGCEISPDMLSKLRFVVAHVDASVSERV